MDNFSSTPVPSPQPLPPVVSQQVNQTALGKLVDDLVAVLDEGPVSFDPKVAMTLAIATPLVLLAMCLMCLVCRGVPYVCCGGRCTYWRRMPKDPKGLEPDGAIGEHQDEHCETDSVDEEARVEQPLPDAEEDDDEDLQDITPDSGAMNGQRECCATMASVLQAGAMEEEEEVPASKPKPNRGTRNGKAKMSKVSIVEPME